MRTTLPLAAALLLAAIAPLAFPAAAQAADEVRAEDARGDVVLRFAPEGMPRPAAPALVDALDLVSVAVHGEDAEGFTIELAVADLAPEQDAWQRHVDGAQYRVAFELTGALFDYEVWVAYEPLGAWDWDWDERPTPGVGPQVRAMLLAREAPGEDDEDDDGDHRGSRSADAVARLEAVADFDANTIAVRVPRAALEREGPGELSVAPERGDALAGLAAESFAWWPGPVGDRAPDEGGIDFPFAEGSANSLVRLGWPAPDGERGGEEHRAVHRAHALEPAAVTLGAPTMVELVLENRGAAPQVVALQARVLPAAEDGAPADGFAVRVADAAELAPGQKAAVRVVATLVAPVPHLTPATLEVRGLTAGGDLALARAPLVAADGPSAERNVLRLHTAPVRSANPVMGALQDQVEHRHAWLNTLEADPLADDAPLRLSGVLEASMGPQGGTLRVFGTGYRGAAMDTPLARPLALAAGEPIVLTAGLRSSAAESGVLRAVVYAGEERVARGEAPVQLAANEDTPVELALAPEALRFGAEPGARLRLYLAYETGPAVPEPVGLRVAPPRELLLLPPMTSLALPVDAPAEAEVPPLVEALEPARAPPLEPSSRAQRDVPGAGAALLGGALAAAAVLAGRRRG